MKSVADHIATLRADLAEHDRAVAEHAAAAAKIRSAIVALEAKPETVAPTPLITGMPAVNPADMTITIGGPTARATICTSAAHAGGAGSVARSSAAPVPVTVTVTRS